MILGIPFWLYALVVALLALIVSFIYGIYWSRLSYDAKFSIYPAVLMCAFWELGLPIAVLSFFCILIWSLGVKLGRK